MITGVFAIYSPALSFQFVLDDHHFVTDPRLQSPGHVWGYFTNDVWAQVVGGVGLQEGNTGSTQSPDYGLCLLETARAQAQFDKAAATKSYQQLLDLSKNDFIPLAHRPSVRSPDSPLQPSDHLPMLCFRICWNREQQCFEA